MAQIIKHRRGSLEGLSAVTSSVQKGELLIATGSSNLTTVNGASLVFAAAADGQIQAVNRFLQGNSVPNTFSNASYNGLVNGVPYYHSGSATLYLLGSDANTAINLEGNIQPFSASVSSSIAALSASVGGGAGVSITNLNTFSGSVLTRLTEIGVVSGSLIASASAAKTTNDSQDISITNINTFSSSVLTRLTEIGVVSGSLISSASNAASRLTNIEAFSSSFDTAFNLSGTNVTIAGNLTVQGTTTQVDSTTIQLGDNIIELNGTGAANGGLLVKDPTAPNTVSGSLLWDSTNDYWKAGGVGSESKLLRADGDSVVSGSSQITLQSTTGFTAYDTALSTITGSLITSASAAKTTNDSQGVSITNLNTTTASLNTSVTNLNTYTSSLKTALSLSGADLTILGNLTVQGDTTTLNTSNLLVEDKLIEIATGTTSSAAANGAGIFISGANASILWDDANSTLDINKAIDIVGNITLTGNVDGVDVSVFNSNVNSTTASLNTSVTNINLTTASLNTSVSNLNTFSGSALTRLSALEVETANLELFSGSANTRFTEIGVVSGSLISSASAAKTTNDSQDVSITNINSFSSSVLTRLTEIGVVSGSLIASASTAKTTNDTQDVSISNLNSHSSSVLTRLTEIGVVSGSLIASASNAASRLTTLEGTGTIQGLGTSNNVTFAKVTTSGDVVVGGDLVVQGNTVTLNTATLIVEDKLITLASGSTSSATADGAGFEVAGANANFVYQHSTTAFTSSVALIAPAVTASVNLGTAAGNSKRIAFRNTNGNLDLVPTGSVSGDLLQWNGTDFIMSNTIDGGSF